MPVLLRSSVRPREGILYKSGHITVAFADFGSDSVYITFNEMGVVAKGTDFWGKGFFAKEKISAIGVVSARPNWYPEEDMEEAVAAIRSFIERKGYKKIVTYGFSQGGYGALKYGRALSADAAVAFAPQYSNNPDDVGTNDGRFTSYFKAEIKGGLAIQPQDLCAQNYIFVDRNDARDNYHIEKIAALGPVNVMHVPFTEHGTIGLLADGKMGRDFLEEIISHGGRKTVLRTLLRKARSASHNYWRARTRWLIQKNRSRAWIKDSMRQTELSLPDHMGYHVNFIELQLSVKNFDYVRKQAKILIPKLNFKESDHRIWGGSLAFYLEHIGDHEEAQKLRTAMQSPPPLTSRIAAYRRHLPSIKSLMKWAGKS